jgi:hypothetical protein
MFNIENLIVHTNVPVKFPLHVNWRLKKLVVENSLDVHSFMRLLGNQKAYLQELDVHVNSMGLDFIMREMRGLKKLKVTLKTVEDCVMHFDFSNEEIELKELTIAFSQFMRSNFYMIQILRHYSNIEKLVLDTSSMTHKTDALKLPKLHTLEVKFLDNFVLQNATFSNLRKLTINAFRMGPPRGFRRIESLEELEVKHAGLSIHQLVQNYPNIKRLKLGDIRIRERELRTILHTLPRLQSLTMRSNAWEILGDPIEVLRVMGGEAINIYFY